MIIRKVSYFKRDKLRYIFQKIVIKKCFLFTTLIPEDQKDKPLKRGVGSQRQSKIVVMSESSFVENPKPGKKPKRINHLKMLVIDDLKADTILNTVKEPHAAARLHRVATTLNQHNIQ